MRVSLSLAFAAALLAASAGQARPVSVKDRLPKTVLTCGGSTITDIGPRLEGDKDNSSGTSVFFRNGGAQVSYDKIDAILNSKKGDHVMICLVFVPKNCPKGDKRGRIYTTTNLRTLESWTLADSQHSCGGA
jgi:hypothetical protein